MFVVFRVAEMYRSSVHFEVGIYTSSPGVDCRPRKTTNVTPGRRSTGT